MSNAAQGPDWWQASDGKWYAPELHPNYRVPHPTLPPPEPLLPPSSPLQSSVQATAQSMPAATSTVASTAKQRKPIYKRWWFLTAAVFVLLMVIGAIAAPSEEDDQAETGGTTAPTQAISDTAPSTSMATRPAQVATTQSAPVATTRPTPVATTRPTPVATTRPTPVDAPPAPESNLTTSQQAAVRSAESYLGFAGFSRQGLIDQLSSEFGEQFTLEQATYAATQVGLC
jgi:hypothetical protein